MSMNQRLLWSVFIVSVVGIVWVNVNTFLLSPSGYDQSAALYSLSSTIKAGSSVMANVDTYVYMYPSGSGYYLGMMKKGETGVVESGPVYSFFPSVMSYYKITRSNGVHGYVKGVDVSYYPTLTVYSYPTIYTTPIKYPTYTTTHPPPSTTQYCPPEEPYYPYQCEEDYGYETEYEAEWICEEETTTSYPTTYSSYQSYPYSSEEVIVKSSLINARATPPPVCAGNPPHPNCKCNWKKKKKKATWYHEPGCKTSNGEDYNESAKRVAVPRCERDKLLNKCLKITTGASCGNNKSIIVKVNDTGSKIPSGGVDLPKETFKDLIAGCNPPIGFQESPPAGEVDIIREEVPCPPG